MALNLKARALRDTLRKANAENVRGWDGAPIDRRKVKRLLRKPIKRLTDAELALFSDARQKSIRRFLWGDAARLKRGAGASI